MNYKYTLLISLALPTIAPVSAWSEQEIQEYEVMLKSTMLPKIKPGTVLTRQEEIQALEEQIAEDEILLVEFKQKVYRQLHEDTLNPRTAKDFETYLIWRTGLLNMKNKLKRLKEEEATQNANQ